MCKQVIQVFTLMNASFIQTVSSLLAEAFVNTPPPPAFKKVFPLPE